MKIFLGLFVIFISIRNAMAGDIVDWYTSDDNVLEFNGYLNRIHSGVVLTAGSPDSNIILTESMDIQNQGTIYGNLVANNDNWVRINNTGTITGYIIAQHVTQIITSGAGATRLNVISNDFSVKVDGASDGVNLVDLMGLGSRSIEFNQSVIIVDNFSDWQNWDALISWTGTNTLDIRDVTTIESGTYVRNIYGNTVNVLLSDENKLYRLEKIYDVHGLMLNVVRETDYQKIFDDNRGSFLETLRINNPNDKMLMAMDAAKNMTELQNIMNSSYRFNRGILIRPVKSIANFSIVDGLFDGVSGVGVVPMYIGSDDMHSFGMRAYINTNYSDYKFGIDLRLNKFAYEDNINDFTGSIYGIGINLKRKIDKFAIAGQVGLDVVAFDADSIYTNDDVKNNPRGYALYGGIDGMRDYSIYKNVILAPFVGGVLQRFDVLDFSENNFNLRGGGIIKYDFVIDSIKYEYGAMIGMMTNSDTFVNLKIGFESLVDNAGLSFNVGAYKDDNTISYRALINANTSF